MIRERMLACEDVDAVKAVLKDMRSSFGGEVVVDGTSVDDVVLLSVISTQSPEDLCKGCKAPEEVVSSLLSPARVAKAMASLTKLVTSAAADLGTHNPKAPDPTVRTDSFFEAAPGRPGAIPFMSGGFENAARSVGGSGGDAKRGKATRLLRSRIRYGNQAASFGEVVSESGPFRELLVRAGWPADVIEGLRSAVAAKADGPTRVDRVHPATKVILFPLPDGGYRQISPVTSVALWYELRTRVARDRAKEGAERRTYPTRRRSVGGTKTQNVGVEASDSGGRMELLLSMPPRPMVLRQVDRILYKLRFAGTCFLSSRPEEGLLDALRRLSFGTHVNANIRGGRERALASVASVWLEGPVTVSRAMDAGMEVDLAPFRDPVERLLVSEGFEALDRAATNELGRGLGRYVASLAADDGDALYRFLGDEALDTLVAAIADALSPDFDEAVPEQAGGDETEEVEDRGDDDGEEGRPPPARTKARPAKAGAKRPSRPRAGGRRK